MTRKLQLAGPTARHASAERPFEAIDPADIAADGQARARCVGADHDEIAFRHLREQGATILCCQHQVGVVTVDADVRGANGAEYRVLAHGNVDPDTTAKLPGLPAPTRSARPGSPPGCSAEPATRCQCCC